MRRCETEGRAGLVAYLTAGDPDLDTSARLFGGLAAAGADLIEIGMPFSDPMADGPVIQEAGQRALKQGMTLRRTLALVRELRRADEATPIVLMGYYNPIYRYGPESFAQDAAAAGVDGVIVVDLPPEEDAELTEPARAAGLDFVRLATPTSDEHRLPASSSTPAAFSITSRSPASPAPARPMPPMSPPRSPGCAGSPDCRSRSASASAPRSKPPKSRAPPTPRSSAPPSSSASPSTSTPTTPPNPASSTPSSPTSAHSPKGYAMRVENRQSPGRHGKTRRLV